MSRSLHVQSVALAIMVGMSGAAAFGDELPIDRRPVAGLLRIAADGNSIVGRTGGELCDVL